MKTDQAFSIDRDVRLLFEGGSLAGLTDGQLLERFQTGSCPAAERAFATLVERHGPMVLRTCRRILYNDHDSHDAFQATFLVLVRKARSLWVRDSLGPWLHRVACRAAFRARTLAARRSEAERGLIDVASPPTHDGFRSELLTALHEELARLPEHYRAALVLCELEGLTCEETARRLGCPAGTVGSRLARGRLKLRDRLLRRGLAPTLGAIAGSLSLEAIGATVPPTLVATTVNGAVEFAACGSGGGTTLVVVEIVRHITRSLFMAQIKTFSATLATAGTFWLIPAVTYNSLAAPRPQAAGGQDEKPAVAKNVQDQDRKRDLDAANFARRHENYVLAEIGNMLPLIEGKQGVSMTSREVVLQKDGTVELWTLQDPRAVCPPLTHNGPIREASFFDGSGILVTTSDDAVKVWDGATGALRKELPGQFMRPLFFLQSKSGAKRFATVETAGRVVTIRDAKTLDTVATLETKGAHRLLGAAISPDGTILATLADDHSVTLSDLSTRQEFATLRSPSRLLRSVFIDDEVKSVHKPVLQLQDTFWTAVRENLLPSDQYKRMAKPPEDKPPQYPFTSRG